MSVEHKMPGRFLVIPCGAEHFSEMNKPKILQIKKKSENIWKEEYLLAFDSKFYQRNCEFVN